MCPGRSSWFGGTGVSRLDASIRNYPHGPATFAGRFAVDSGIYRSRSASSQHPGPPETPAIPGKRPNKPHTE